MMELVFAMNLLVQFSVYFGFWTAIKTIQKLSIERMLI